ncbi:MAG: protein O-mannosyl-transferase family [Hyphomicrobiales bacterium]
MRRPRDWLATTISIFTVVGAFSAYAATAARTITWWDGSGYPLAAVTLGIPGAPGSLLLTLLGWVVSRIPVVEPIAFRLNLFAAWMAAVLVGVVAWLGAHLSARDDRRPGRREYLAGGTAGLLFAFSVTPWTYAVQFTPYVLSALWTGLILVALLSWWRRPAESSGRLLIFVIFLLFGLDLSVHRTNALLFPAALFLLALRRPRGRIDWRAGIIACGGLALGLGFHLLLIPLAARRPSYLVEDPSTWAGWWSYVSIEAKGGGFLLRLFPRAASFFKVQMGDYGVFLARNLSPMLFLPAILAGVGWIAALRRDVRLAAGWLALFLFAGVGAVVYFNLPLHYMRPIDRHYLPSLVILAPMVAAGIDAALRGARRLPGGGVIAPCLGLVLAATPALAWRSNHDVCDLSRNRFTETFARDLLDPLPRRAILLTNGDNDTIPLWYLQQVEGVRPDVEIINLPLANTESYLAQLRRRDPDFGGLLTGESLPEALRPRRADGDVATVVEARSGLGLPPGVVPPDTVRFHPEGILFGQDRVILDLLRRLRWRRPVYLACTVVPKNLAWLWPFARLDGLAFRVVPSADPGVWDVDHLRRQLFEHMRYTDLDDTTVSMDRVSYLLASNYIAALVQLADAQVERGRVEEARETLGYLRRRVPPERFGWDTGAGGAFLAKLDADVARGAKRPTSPPSPRTEAR